MQAAPSISAGPSGQAATEQTFLDVGGVVVTNSRFIVPGQTYAMSGVTSIKHVEKDPSKVAGWVIIGIGVLLCLSHAMLAVGILMILGGALYLWKGRGKYDVLLQTASGEVRAFASKDKELVRRIVNALNEAIVYRG